MANNLSVPENPIIQSNSRINLNYQSKHGENGLFEAVSYKRMDIVEMLLNHQNCEVDIVDQHDRTPFLVACQYGYSKNYTMETKDGRQSLTNFWNRN